MMISGQSQQLRAPQVEYHRLGNSGLRVSLPIVGGGSFGSPKWFSWVLEEDKSFEVLKAAWDRGVNTIDTSNNYSNGESELIIGKFLKKYNIPRHRILIFTKCFNLVSDEGIRAQEHAHLRDTRNYVNQSGLSRAAIFNQVEASLQRLQISYIDMLQIHRFDPETPIEETMKALHDLVKSGKVRYLGACTMRCWQFAKMNEVARRNGWTSFVSMQSEYSLLYREEEREMIPYCKAHGIGHIPWSPLHRGDIAKPITEHSTRREETKGTFFEVPLTEADTMIINRVEELAEKKSCTMAEVALAWIRMKVTSSIVGVNSVSVPQHPTRKAMTHSLTTPKPERLNAAITNDITLTEEELKYLEEPYVPKPVRGHK